MKNIKSLIAAGIIFSSMQINAQSWSTTGNAGTTPAVNFLGTTNNQSLVIRTNNAERMRVDSTGRIGIGTNAPAAGLHLVKTTEQYGLYLEIGRAHV